MVKSISFKKRHQVSLKTNGECWYCGSHVGIDFVVEHAIPVSKGGTNDIDNLLPACRACNSEKRDKNVEQYREYLKSKDPARIAATEIDKLLSNGIDEDEELLLAAMHCLRRKADPVIFFGERLRSYRHDARLK
ncbi:MAG: HNH endonuclease [Candidatus Nanopelagicaceae bacterium]